MRIAHVTSGLDRNAAGVGAAVADLSSTQASLGHDVQVFGLRFKEWTNGDINKWVGAPALALPVLPILRPIGFAPGLAQALSQFDPDIVHLHGLWMYPSLAVLRWHRRTCKPYVYSVHGMLSPISLGFSPRKKRLARILFQDAALRSAAALVATSDVEVDQIKAFGLINRTAVVPHGTKTGDIPLAPKNTTKRVLYLGRFHPQKGLDQLIRAWSQVERMHPNWHLDLVGPDDPRHRADLESLTADLAVQRVHFKPAVYGIERDACMASADLFVLPTLGENFALTVAESLMMGTPVVVTQGAPWPGLRKKGCGWWIENGIDPLAKTLDEAMHLSDEERRSMGQLGRQWMLCDFSWASVAEKLQDVYDYAVSPPPRVR